MTQQTISNGETGLSVRTKLNANFEELYTNKDLMRLQHRFNEEFIRAVAGCPSGIRLGPQVGVTPGLSDAGSLAGASSTGIVVTSLAEMAADADSGSGTAASPYIVENRDLTTSSAGLNLHPGYYINDSANKYFVTFRNCRIRGFSRGLLRFKTAAGSVIAVENCVLDAGYNANVTASRMNVIVNNCDGDEVETTDIRGTRVVVKGCAISSATVDRPGYAYGQGWYCRGEFYDCTMTGSVWLSGHEELTSSHNDWGDRHLRVWRCNWVDGYSDGDNFGCVMVGAPGVSFDVERVNVAHDASLGAGLTKIPFVFSAIDAATIFPVRCAPRGTIRYCNVEETSQRGIDLQWVWDTKVSYVTITANGTSRRAFQFGKTEVGGLDKMCRNSGVYRCRANYTGASGGTTCESFMQEETDSGYFIESFADFTNNSDTGGDDAFEAYGAQGVIEYVGLVTENCTGQVVDSFTNNDTRPSAEFAVVRNIYGTCKTEAVQLTQVNGAAVFDVLATTGLGGTQTTQGSLSISEANRALIIAYTRFSTGEAAKNIIIGGLMSFEASIGNINQNKVFYEAVISPGNAFDTSNGGYYVQDGEVEGYNRTTEEIAAFLPR